ncbi:MAG: hypothetical protein HY270_21410, partial [Deltaproteobacteria bacterium]|nr:hypothetical protein [Deltaproteobacteria bacterium]
RPIDPKQIKTLPPDAVAHRLFKGCWEGPSGRVIILDAEGLVNTAVALVTRGFRERRIERHQNNGTR